MLNWEILHIWDECDYYYLVDTDLYVYVEEIKYLTKKAKSKFIQTFINEGAITNNKMVGEFGLEIDHIMEKIVELTALSDFIWEAQNNL